MTSQSLLFKDCILLVVLMMKIIIIIIIIALKGANQVFTISSQHCELSPTHGALITKCATRGANAQMVHLCHAYKISLQSSS